jgi:hypothetical protein
MPPGTDTQKLAQLTEEFKEYKKSVKETKVAVESLTDSVGRFVATGAKSTEKVRGLSTAYEDMQKVLKNTTNITSMLTDGMEKVVSSIKILGPVASAAGAAIGGIGKAFGAIATAVVEGPKAFITALDDQTRGLREFESEMFDLNKRFGGTVDEAKSFADVMRKASDNPLAKSLHLTTNEMAGFVRATKNTSLTQAQLSQTVETGAGVIQLFGAATAFAESTNMSFNESATLMNTLMNKQGKSAQEATNMLGMFVGVAQETGLSIDKVSTSLNSAVSQFAKIGMAADFGKPIMEGFANTMSDMGLGIEESIGLSNTLTQSLAGLTNNYGMAYLTFQRGGLDIGGGGGGGVLGSSIALQSAYLDAEKTGDQGAISDQLVRGMRDTLASFTGGDIVTVQQANEDSSMQNQFYVQQQMLKSQFGVSDDNSAARILDMLSRLDEATASGDVDAQDKLKEQINNEKRGRDLTLDEMEKVNRKLETQINLMTVSLRMDLDQTRRVAGSAGRGVGKLLPGAIEIAEKGIGMEGKALKRMADYLGLEEGSKSADIMNVRWDEHKKANRLKGDSPMNIINAMDANSAFTEVKKSGDAGTDKLTELFAHRLGKTSFGDTKSVAKADIAMVAKEIAEMHSATGPGDKDALAEQIAKEMGKALGNMKITLTDKTGNGVDASVQKLGTPSVNVVH